MKQFCVTWRFIDKDTPIKQTLHMCDTSEIALRKSRNIMMALRYNVSQLVANVKEFPQAPAKPPAKKPVKISTEVDRQGDFWWNQF